MYTYHLIIHILKPDSNFINTYYSCVHHSTLHNHVLFLGIKYMIEMNNNIHILQCRSVIRFKKTQAIRKVSTLGYIYYTCSIATL